MGCHSLLQAIFPAQGLNPGLLYCRQILYHLSHQGSLVLHCLPKFAQTHVHGVSDAIQLSHLLSPPSLMDPEGTSKSHSQLLSSLGHGYYTGFWPMRLEFLLVGSPETGAMRCATIMAEMDQAWYLLLRLKFYTRRLICVYLLGRWYVIVLHSSFKRGWEHQFLAPTLGRIRLLSWGISKQKRSKGISHSKTDLETPLSVPSVREGMEMHI